MTRKKRNSVAKAITQVILGLLLIVALWVVLSALFSASPPIHYVTSCSMYPEYSRGDVLVVLPLSPPVPVMGYGGLLSQAQPWVVSYGNATASLAESISTYCNNSIEQMCRKFYANATGFSESNGPVSYEYANCNVNHASGARTEPCVFSATVGNTSFSTLEKPQAIAYSVKVFSGAPAIPVIHRAFFGVRDADNSTFYYTKGDANTLFDAQSKGFFLLNSGPAAGSAKVMGVVVAKIPFVGEFLRNYRGIEGCEGSGITIK
jgi:hypothetical protein